MVEGLLYDFDELERIENGAAPVNDDETFAPLTADGGGQWSVEGMMAAARI